MLKYIVNCGDTIDSIAKKFCISAQTILLINNLRSPILKVGQQLLIPENNYNVNLHNNLSMQATQYLPVTAYTVTQPVIVNGSNINTGLYPVLNFRPANATYPFIYVPISEFSKVGANVVWDDTRLLLTVTTDYYTLKNQALALTNETSYLRSVIDSIVNDGLGNSASNIMETGFVAQEGEWIYYRRITRYDPTTPGMIYKIRKDGSGDTKLNDDKSYYINVLNGWIYYSDLNRIYKIRTDGSEQTLLTNEFGQLNVSGNWIYYNSSADGNKIYKISIDGTNKTKLNDDSSSSLNIVQDWIYYRNAADRKMYKVRIDGTGRQKLNDVIVWGSVKIIDGWIYYSDYGTQTDTWNIFRMKLDGTNITRLSTDSIERFNISGGYIYYTKIVDVPGGDLYKMRVDGTNKMAFNIRNVIQLNVIGDWVYYLTMNKTTYKVRVDGTGNTTMYPIDSD